MGRTRTWGEYILGAGGAAADATTAIHPECLYATVDVAANATTVYNGPAILFGVYVNTVLSAHLLPIQDGISATFTVGAASLASPTEITTTAAHGLVSGQTVTFAGMPGDFAAPLNGLNFKITYVAATKFTIAVDAGAFGAYTSGGTVTGATTVAWIPASSAVGTMFTFPGVRFENSLIVNPSDAADGSIVLAYRPV